MERSASYHRAPQGREWLFLSQDRFLASSLLRRAGAVMFLGIPEHGLDTECSDSPFVATFTWLVLQHMERRTNFECALAGHHYHALREIHVELFSAKRVCLSELWVLAPVQREMVLKLPPLLRFCADLLLRAFQQRKESRRRSLSSEQMDQVAQYKCGSFPKNDW